MKLLFCKKCHDIVALVCKDNRACCCGESSGQYIDEINVQIKGDYAIPLGIDNHSFVEALRKRPQDGLGSRFEAFVIPKKCPTIEHPSKV